MQPISEKNPFRTTEDEYIDWLLRETKLVSEYKKALDGYPKLKKKTV